MMTVEKSTLEEMKAAIKEMRDEVALKAHLGKAETAEELEKLDKKWQNFKLQLKPFTDEVEKTAGDAGSALGLAADELKAGYDRIRKLL
ncbi:MAG: hypothetical protein ABFS19_11455 [Thermodesulfobacteriota bacterium]